MSQASAPGLLDDLFKAIDQHPQGILWLVVWVLGLYFFTFVVVFGLCVILILRLSRRPYWIIVLALSVPLLLMQVFFFQITPTTLIQWNHLFYHDGWQGDWQGFPWEYLLIINLPYGLLLGGVSHLLMEWRSGIHRELQRVGRGQLKTDKAILSPKKKTQALQRLEALPCKDAILLGVDCHHGFPVYLSKQDANLHTLAIGTTGSGKTTALVNFIEYGVQQQFPVCYVDGKGDLGLMQAIREFAKTHGIPFYGFSMVGPSQSYNPIASGGFTSKKDRMIELRTWSEDHYRKIAEGYLQTAFELLTRCHQSVDLVALSKVLDPIKLSQLARTQKDKTLIDRVSELESDYASIRSLVCEIQNLVHSEIGYLFHAQDDSTIELPKALSKNGIVYFCLQPLAFPAYADTLGKLIINDLKALLATRLTQSIKPPLLAIFDEFSVFAGDQVVNLINQGRSAGAHIVLATQSLSDIQRKGGDALLGQILNNVNNYVIQRQNYPKDAEVLADIIGTKAGFEVTSQLNMDAVTPSTGTVRQSRRFIIHPDEIKRLGLGEAILVNKQRFQMQRLFVRQGRILLGK